MDREDMECITLNVAVKAVPIDFSLNTSLSELSWRIADRHIPLEEAIDIFRKITVEATGRKGKYVPLLVAVVATCRCQSCFHCLRICIIGARVDRPVVRIGRHV